MSLSTIILEAGGVFAHNTNQDGSGNIGVNVENTPSVSISGTVNVAPPTMTTSSLGDAATYTTSTAGTTHTNPGAIGVLIGLIFGTVSGTISSFQPGIQWSQMTELRG
jgi:hypothetical protein